MSRSIVVYVPGDPVPKERPRVYGRVGITTPKTREYERRVSVYGLQARGEYNRGRAWPLRGWYRVDLRFCREQARGDADNVLKSVLDGLRGVLYEDDARVCEIGVVRSYSGPVGTWVTVTELERPEGAPEPRERPKPAKRPSARAKQSTAAAAAASPWRSRAVLPARGHGGGT